MILGLLRHAIAEEADGSRGLTDDLRELTPEGRSKMTTAAQGIRLLDLDFDLILTSPLTRCVQTAQIVAAAVGVPAQVVDRLRPGLDAERLIDVLMDVPQAERILVCGHQPDMSNVAYDLTRGGRLEFKKGALAIIETDSPPRLGAGLLLAHLPPRALRTLGRGVDDGDPGESDHQP